MEDLIYCQKDIPKAQWKYGLRSSAVTGCGWIAAYNGLRLMGYEADPEELIAAFQRQLPLVHGNLGTTILAPAFYFRKRGFEVDWTAREDRFDACAKEYPVCILFYRRIDRWKLGAHFVALHWTETGFVGYNTYTNSKGPDRYGPSLAEFLKQKKYFGPVLMGIRPGKESPWSEN
jgi:hypothetical protein